jgi:hypothetical protein
VIICQDEMTADKKIQLLEVSNLKNMVPKGYHKMPGGKLMKNSEHEKTESKKERMMEYGSTKKTKAEKKMSKVMKEYKAGELNIGKSKKMVKNPKQAIAIGLSVSGMSKKKGGK